MKSLCDLLEQLLQECGSRGGAATARDVATLRDRVKHEGDSFITITLPTFCSDFERCLAVGRVVPGLFLSFRKEKSGIPSFLKGFLYRVFDEHGDLRPNPSTDCVLLIRQICLFGKKVLRPCTKQRERTAVDEYARCDDEVVSSLGDDENLFQQVSRVVVQDLDVPPDAESLLGLLRGAHGPGRVRERCLPNQKWGALSRWPERVEVLGFTLQTALFGADGFSACTPRELRPDLVSPWEEDPVRVVLVPKTQKSPRVIAVEPAAKQFVQQALWRFLARRISNAPITSGHVNFTDQSINQELALSSSMDGRLATLDMKEASDRVSVEHVTNMLGSNQSLLALVLACRSGSAELPDGSIKTLKKFASMGSALCFPMEALTFFISIIAIRLKQRGLPPLRRHILEMSRDVYVYGDDLIVPSDEAPAICSGLESFGFKVNYRKSFWSGNFRESCGVDAFRGKLVTPVYLRRDVPTDRRDASGILSTVATANQLFEAGFTRTARLLREEVESVLGRLPTVSRKVVQQLSKIVGDRSVTAAVGPAIGWSEFSEFRPRRRYNRALQRVEILCWVPVVSRVPDPLEGYGALAKCLRVSRVPLWDAEGAPEESLFDPEHLKVSPRPFDLALNRRWVPEFPTLGIGAE